MAFDHARKALTTVLQDARNDEKGAEAVMVRAREALKKAQRVLDHARRTREEVEAELSKLAEEKKR